jgi:hypothetical protein
MNTIQIEIPKNPQQIYRSDSPLRRAGLTAFGLGLLVFIVGATGAFSTV